MNQSTNLSKIQIRAQVLQAVLKFKNIALPSDSEIESCIDVLNSVNDKNFVTLLLLKEISANGTTYDNILGLLLLSVSDSEVLTKNILDMLSDRTIPDGKKLFLINMLREQGEHIDYNFIQSCINNPDEVIDIETKKFLEDAKLNPETQIDFFDFYFTVNKNDRQMLVESMIEDYSGDELANILAPFAYFYPQDALNTKIIDSLASSKSYLALEPLEHIISHCDESEQVSCAKKALKKLKIAGLREKPEKSALYKPMFGDSMPIGFWYSLADGNSNLSCVFARERISGTIQTFFTVFNLVDGAISSFGFNEIAKGDFDTVLMRFFKSSLKAQVPIDEGKLIFDTLGMRTFEKKSQIPYEFICWRQLTYDIVPPNENMISMMTSCLNKIPTGKKIVFEILNSEIFSNWFYEYNSLAEFSQIADKIEKDNIVDIASVEMLIDAASVTLLAQKEFKDALIEKIIVQSYILKKSAMNLTADSLYSVIFDDELLNLMLKQIIKKSIYVYFFSKCSKNLSNTRENIFAKRQNKNLEADFAKKFVKAAEEKWT